MNLTEDHIIQVSGLTKSFGTIPAVSDLDFNVGKGDIYGFLGPNGSGKSTTIRMLLSLVYPDRGDILLFGKALHKNRMEILSRTGALAEKPDFYEYLSAYGNLKLLLRYSNRARSSKRIFEVLEMVGLEERAHSKVKTFSKGMKQRLGIAQAILHDPELIILDEPGSGLDPAGIRDIRNIILHLNREQGKTILLSSHLLFEVEQLANRMIIINRGKKIIEGPVSELLSKMEQNVVLETGDTEMATKVIGGSGLITGTPEQMHGSKLLLRMHGENIPALVKVLTDQRVEIYSLHRSQNLEELFINLT